MSPHPDPEGAYRQAVAEGLPPAQIIRAARRCTALSVEDAVPALLALASRTDDLFDRAADRWIARYQVELDRPPDEREVALMRGALAALPAFDMLAAIGADALAQLLDLRGMDYARDAVVRWSNRLP